LVVDLIWRNLLYLPVERETLFRLSLDWGIDRQRKKGKRLCLAKKLRTSSLRKIRSG
jgi:hypothetical protein